MSNLRLLEISGSPAEMGRQYGAAYPQEIRELTEDRLQLSSNKNWTGQELSRQEVLALGRACLPYHEAYAPELMAELRGMSEATGLGVTELVILNGFTDFVDVIYSSKSTSPEFSGSQRASQFAPAPPASPERKVDRPEAAPAQLTVDNCTAFIVSPDVSAEGHGFLGQTWDMHETATPYVILLRGQPAQGLRFLTLTIIGCLGMIGINEAGIAIGINNLVDSQGQVGVTWPFVVRQVLAQDNLDDALACITTARLAGGHNYLLVNQAGRGYNIEAMASRYHIEEVTSGTLVHTNHCLISRNVEVERARLPKSRASSETRLSRAQALLQQERITLADLLALTRDHEAMNGICVHPEEPFFLESCGAAIMRPATREMWAVWGQPCQHEYERFTV